MLLQKRNADKPTWPLFGQMPVALIPIWMNRILIIASRRLKEEMGFEVPLTEKLRFVYEADYDKVWGEHEHDVVFEGKYDGEIKSDPQEVADWKWMRVDDLKRYKS